jgi:site-specific DNA-methyltransferase (adenine-specific)
MVCAIEDAGFEIRDTIAWLYGSGCPKSHNVAKGIDKHGGQSVAWFGPWFRAWRKKAGITQKQVAALFPSKTGGLTGCVANWELGLNMPTPDQFNLIRDTFALPFDSIASAEREVIGQRVTGIGTGTGSVRVMGDGNRNVTVASTDAAKQWDGWGTALKPAMELICLARKPLTGTVAANVLEHGTGALNIGGCRIGTTRDVPALHSQSDSAIGATGISGKRLPDELDPNVGRWPANVCHDGSAEVVRAFPPETGKSNGTEVGNFSGWKKESGEKIKDIGFGDSGSAARFFYSAKADADDRLGSKHPTVKPVDLMRWLVRLVTPPGGTCLDPFAGSGTTGMACMAEGFDCILVEQDAESIADIKRRIEHVRGIDLPLFAFAKGTPGGMR